jgi:nucleotide-binding universal stress UspA family protein
MRWVEKERVVVPVDLSEFSFAAVEVARDFVTQNSSIYVVHVIREINPNLSGGLLGKEHFDQRDKVSQEALQERLSNEYPGIQIQTLTGEPGESIADFASNIQADLIIMTSHGRRGVKKHLLGSVAERVLRLAQCSVLTIKPHFD